MILKMKRACFPAKCQLFQLFIIYMSLSTMSRTTGFRYLRELNHLTSYTHNGEYYTLPEITEFEFSGFWYFGHIGFSIHGTLINTLHQVIAQSEAGKFNFELEKHFRVRVQAALRTLLRSKKITRVKLKKKYLYINTDSSISNCQIRKRMEMILDLPCLLTDC